MMTEPKSWRATVLTLWFGDRTAKEAGRVTLNPIPHIDPFGSIVLPATCWPNVSDSRRHAHA